MTQGRAGEFQYEGLPRFVTNLEKWFSVEQRVAYDTAVLPDGKDRLLLGVLVFGTYVDRFLRYCVPSLLSPGNLKSLFEPLVVIHTNATSVGRIEAGIVELRKCARVEIYVVPEEILSQVPEKDANKYWLLGAALNLHMQQAKYWAHSYHMLMPDHVYAVGYFSALKWLAQKGKQAIVQGALSGQIEKIGPVLEDRLGSIGPSALASLVVDNMHGQMLPFLMNGRVDYPTSLLMVMIGADRLHIMSPHMTIIYLSHALLMCIPLRLFNTTDSQLPFLIPDDVEPYVPSVEDGMVYAELSDLDKPAFFKEGCDLNEFCARFWIMNCCCRGYERFFGLTTVMQLTGRPKLKPMSDDDISALKQRVRNAVAISYDEIYSSLPEHLRRDPMSQVAA